MLASSASGAVASVARDVLRRHARAGARRRGGAAVAAAAAALPREQREELLLGVDRGHVHAVGRALELRVSPLSVSGGECGRSLGGGPHRLPDAAARTDALRVLSRLVDVGVVASGGYPQAERCRLSVGHAEALATGCRGADSGSGDATGFIGAVSAISVSGDFEHNAVSHGDFLGSVLGTGIVREKVGDILVQVRHTPVTVEPISLADLKVKAPKVDILRTVEASTRLDALASFGFKVSRTKIADCISAGYVKVNWKEVNKGAISLKTGDVISVKGKGRLEVGPIEMTKKGRYGVEITRFV
eukprot:SM000012S25434  [mRNA]  locus=s12:1112985:1115441:+ [translate_table: standard]